MREETKKYSNPLRSSLENHTRSQTKMGKAYTRFQTKTAQKPYLDGVTETYIANIRKYIPPPGYSLFHLKDERDYSRV